MEGRKPLIVDVSPEDVSYDGKNVKGNVTGKKAEFALRTLGYGLRMFLNFLGWSLKSIVKMTIDGFKIAAEGSRELNDQMRGDRPRFAKNKVTSFSDLDSLMPMMPGVEYEIRLKKRF